MEQLTAEKLTAMASGDREVHRIDIPEWDSFTFCRSMSAAEAARLPGEAGGDNAAGIIRMLELALCDENGKRILDRTGAQRLMQQPAGVVLRIVNEVAEFNGIGGLDGIRGNSPTTESDVSGSS